METPDLWCIIKVTHEGETFYKVLASFYGGYASGDSWLLNSGIKSYENLEDKYVFHGFSGSQYHCYKNREGVSSYAKGVYNHLQKQAKPTKLRMITMKTYMGKYNAD